MGLDLDKASPAAKAEGDGAPEIELFVRALAEALEAEDPDALVGSPSRGRRTVIDGSFDLYEVAKSVLSQLSEKTAR